jgi:hypothetical protein
MKFFSMLCYATIFSLPFASFAQDNKVKTTVSSGVSAGAGVLAYKQLMKSEQIYASKGSHYFSAETATSIGLKLPPQNKVILTVGDIKAGAKRLELIKRVDDADSALSLIHLEKKKLQAEANSFATVGLGEIRPKSIGQKWDLLMKQELALLQLKKSASSEFNAIKDIEKIVIQDLNADQLAGKAILLRNEGKYIESITKINRKVG